MPSLSLERAIDLFLDSRVGIVSPKTLRNNRLYLSSLSALYARPAESITLDDLRAWRKSLLDRKKKYSNHRLHPTERAPLSIYTIRGHVETVRQFFNWLHHEGLTKTHPAYQLEIPPLPQSPPRSISDADVKKMIRACRSKRDKALLLFLRDTGCRVGGASSLRLSDLDELRYGRVTVCEKGNKSRVVYLKTEAVSALRAWLKERDAREEYVFTSRYGGRLTEQAIYLVLKKLAQAAGVTGRWNPHAWRHRLARRMLKRGASLGEVSRILGHSNIRVTDQYYGIFAQDELQEAHRKYA